MKKLLLICAFLLLTDCVTDPELADPKLIFYANRSVAEFLPLHIYLDTSFAGSLTDTVEPFDTEFPPLNDDVMIIVDVAPGKYDITVFSLPDGQDTTINNTSLDDIQNDINIFPDFYSNKEINIEMGQNVYQGVGNSY